MLRPSSLLLAAAIVAAPLASAPLAAQAPAVADTARPPAVVGARDARLAGGFALGALAAFALDRPLAERLQRPAVQRNGALHRTATAFRLLAQPGIVVGLPATWAIGRLAGDRTTADIGLHGTEAVAIALGATAVVKTFVGRARPAVNVHDPRNVGFFRGFTEGEEYRSFPSGHTTTAFAAAAALTAETMRRHPDDRWAVGVPAYAAAALVGWSRMYDNRHWASDVTVGAGIGTLAGVTVVRYHHARPGNRTDRWLLGASIDPTRGVVPLVARTR